MNTIKILAAVVIALLFMTGCDSNGNPFAGSQWQVGIHHVSFSHSVAEWNTSQNQLELNFDLINGGSYPVADVLVEEVTTLAVDSPRDAKVHISIATGLEFECDPADPDANATITFTRLDISPLGGVSGTIVGKARDVNNPTAALVDLEVSFSDVAVIN